MISPRSPDGGNFITQTQIMSRKASKLSMRMTVASSPQKDSNSSFDGFDSEDYLEKDKTELELEKLVFGDEVGFQEGLNAYERKNHKTEHELIEGDHSDEERVGEVQGGFEGLDDADVCT